MKNDHTLIEQNENKLLYEKHWYAVHTKSRHEKLVHNLVSHNNIEAYLPIKKLLRKWSDRKKIIEFPLFTGYLFVNMPLIDKNKVLHTKGVVRILGNQGPDIIPEEQIQSLKLFEQHEVEVDPYLHLQPGSLIKVAKGPLKGCTGVLIKKKNKYRLVVNLMVLQQSASVEIDASDIENV